MVPFNGQDTVSSRWVFTDKIEGGVTKRKARMVACGFEEITEETLGTDSPTCAKHSLRTVFLSASLFNWKLESFDVASAFLQGNELTRDVFLRPPKDVCNKYVKYGN